MLARLVVLMVLGMALSACKPTAAVYRTEALARVAAAQAAAGDAVGAEETAALAVESARTNADGDYPARALNWAAWAEAAAGDRAAARATAIRIVDSSECSLALVRVALAQAGTGDVAGARETAALALDIANQIDDDEDRAWALTVAAWAQAAAGDLPGARDTAARVTDARGRFLAWIAVSVAQIGAGDTAGSRETAALAVDTANEITDDEDRAWTLIAAAWVQAAAGDLPGARDTAASLSHLGRRAAALGVMAAARAEAGDAANAREISAMALAELSARGWLGLAAGPLFPKVRARLGFEREAGVVVAAVAAGGPAAKAGIRKDDVILRVDGAEVADQRRLSRLVARTRAGTRMTVEVWRDGVEIGLDVTLDEAPDDADEPDLETVVLTRIAVAVARAAAGDRPGALDAANALSNAEARAVTLSALAVAFVDLGDAAGAKRATALALASTTGFADAEGRGEALREVAEARFATGDLAGAIETIESFAGGLYTSFSLVSIVVDVLTGDAPGAIAQGLEILTNSDSVSTQNFTPVVVAAFQARAGDVAGAIETAKGIVDAEDRAWALGRVALAQARADDEDGARATLLAIVDSLGDASWVSKQVAAFVEAGNIAAAIGFLQTNWGAGTAWPSAVVEPVLAVARNGDVARAVSGAMSLGDPGLRANALAGIASIQAKVGDRPGAQATVARALSAAAGIPQPYFRALALADAAGAQIDAGDATGARETATLAFETAKRIAPAE
ncbi:MAG: PDZ domain-containing protein [Alphaproteobacteria bacterium]